MGNVFTNIWGFFWETHYNTKKRFTFIKTVEKEFIDSKSEAAKSEAVKKKDFNLGDAGNGQKTPKPAYNTSQIVGLILGPVLFALFMWLIPLPELSQEGRAVLAVTVWMSVWWVLEAMPLGITSLMPIILLPLLGTITGAQATSSYGDPNIFLFLGGFAIALAIERWNLHERISLTILSLAGTSTSGLIYGFMFATAFLSMWISNVATVMMLIPIGTAIASKVVALMKQEPNYAASDEEKFTKSMIFAIGFGGIIGGSATLIGTPPNLILAGLVKEMYQYEITFASWFLFAAPLCLILAIFTTFYLTKFAYPLQVKKLSLGKEFVVEEKGRLGKMSHEEKIVAAVFGFTAFMWLTRSFIWTDIIPGISDTMIAVFGAVLLYLIPASKEKGGRILESDSLAKMPWDVLLLVGGGLALAAAFTNTDLSTWIGEQLLLMQNMPIIACIAVTTILTIGITQVAPNTAITTIFVPIAATLALAVDAHPIPFMVAAALGAGFAFMLPIGTPSQAVIYGTGKVTIMDMVKNGTLVTILATVLIIILVYYLLPITFGLDLAGFPAEWK